MLTAVRYFIMSSLSGSMLIAAVSLSAVITVETIISSPTLPPRGNSVHIGLDVQAWSS